MSYQLAGVQAQLRCYIGVRCYQGDDGLDGFQWALEPNRIQVSLRNSNTFIYSDSRAMNRHSIGPDLDPKCLRS